VLYLTLLCPVPTCNARRYHILNFDTNIPGLLCAGISPFLKSIISFFFVGKQQHISICRFKTRSLRNEFTSFGVNSDAIDVEGVEEGVQRYFQAVSSIDSST